MVTVAGQRARSTAEFFFNAPSFELVDSELSSETVEAGESVVLTATVANTGTRSARIPVEIAVDGSVVQQQRVELDVDAETEVAYEHTFEEPGEYEFSVNGVDAGTVTVEHPPTPTPSPTPSPTSTSGQPGFGLGGALAGIVGYLAFRNRRTED